MPTKRAGSAAGARRTGTDTGRMGRHAAIVEPGQDDNAAHVLARARRSRRADAAPHPDLAPRPLSWTQLAGTLRIVARSRRELAAS